MHFFISLIALIGLTFVAAKPQIIGSSNVGCLGECNDVYAQCADTSDTSSGLEAYFEAGGW